MSEFAMGLIQCFEKCMFSIYELQVLMYEENANIISMNTTSVCVRMSNCKEIQRLGKPFTIVTAPF